MRGEPHCGARAGSWGRRRRSASPRALRCITLGAAYVLKMDDQVGSIQCGKRADFCILDRDPTEVDPTELRNVRPVATVLGGAATG
ncbi:MAG: amidohydrolase family protein [Pseudomonadota bacterium]